MTKQDRDRCIAQLEALGFAPVRTENVDWVNDTSQCVKFSWQKMYAPADPFHKALGLTHRLKVFFSPEGAEEQEITVVALPINMPMHGVYSGKSGEEALAVIAKFCVA